MEKTDKQVLEEARAALPPRRLVVSYMAESDAARRERREKIAKWRSARSQPRPV
jgi:uncharacterized NAD(P)/FAD-binding protein YdhS